MKNKVYRVQIIKLDNGYMVESDLGEGHYCSNLKGVTATLYKTFESRTKLNKAQLEFLKESGTGRGDKSEEEKSDA